jgi:hypothetical protein
MSNLTTPPESLRAPSYKGLRGVHFGQATEWR